MKDDRRYMDFETRAIDDARYRGKLERSVPAIETCYCGKTVLKTNGVAVRIDGHAVICPRECKRESA